MKKKRLTICSNTTHMGRERSNSNLIPLHSGNVIGLRRLAPELAELRNVLGDGVVELDVAQLQHRQDREDLGDAAEAVDGVRVDLVRAVGVQVRWRVVKLEDRRLLVDRLESHRDARCVERRGDVLLEGVLEARYGGLHRLVR